MQDAHAFWQRNKNEEGGGGYLAWNWDSSIWGADVLLASLTDGSDATYAAEARAAALYLGFRVIVLRKVFYARPANMHARTCSWPRSPTAATPPTPQRRALALHLGF